MTPRRVLLSALSVAILAPACTGSNSPPSPTVAEGGRFTEVADAALQVTACCISPTSKLSVSTRWNGAILAFDISSSVRCAPHAELTLHNLGDTQHPPPRGHAAALSVYPSRITGALHIVGSQALRGPTLLDNRPRALSVVSPDVEGWVRWDVTDLFTAWRRGGPFPTTGARIRRGSPFVVEVRPPRFVQRPAGLPFRVWGFDGLKLGNTKNAPRLILTPCT